MEAEARLLRTDQETQSWGMKRREELKAGSVEASGAAHRLRAELWNQSLGFESRLHQLVISCIPWDKLRGLS